MPPSSFASREPMEKAAWADVPATAFTPMTGGAMKALPKNNVPVLCRVTSTAL